MRFTLDLNRGPQGHVSGELVAEVSGGRKVLRLDDAEPAVVKQAADAWAAELKPLMSDDEMRLLTEVAVAADA